MAKDCQVTGTAVGRYIDETSQTDLARFLGVGVSTVSAWVASDRCPAMALLACEQHYQLEGLRNDLTALRRAIAVLSRS